MKKKLSQFIEQSQVNNKELNGTEIINVEETPFTIVKLEHDIIITMGKEAVATGFESIEDAKDYIKLKPWQLMLTAAAIYTNHINKIIDKKKKTNETTNE